MNLMQKFFPCLEKLEVARVRHAESIRRNVEACDDLARACDAFKFPPLKDKAIVNPR